MTTNVVAEARRHGQEGFSLIEALAAMVVLSIGLVAIANLLAVSAASNAVGNHTSAAVNIASETMERLRAISFNSITTGGDLDTDAGSSTGCIDNPGTNNCVVVGNFNAIRNVDGVGLIKTRWKVTSVDGQILYFQVRSESMSPLVRSRSRVEYTLFRGCTSTVLGCPTP